MCVWLFWLFWLRWMFFFCFFFVVVFCLILFVCVFLSFEIQFPTSSSKQDSYTQNTKVTKKTRIDKLTTHKTKKRNTNTTNKKTNRHKGAQLCFGSFWLHVCVFWFVVVRLFYSLSKFKFRLQAPHKFPTHTNQQ